MHKMRLINTDFQCYSFVLQPIQVFSINNQYMGLLYSLTSYFYPTSITQLTQRKIKTKSQKLIIRIKNIQYKLQQQVYKLETQLLSQVKQKLPIRSLQGQKVRINMIIQNSQKRLVYDEVIYCLNKIIGQANILQTNPSKISNQCLIAICSIIYVYEPLQLKQFVNINEFIPQPLPHIEISKIRSQIKQFLKKQKINDYQRNLYALQFAYRNKISIEQINLSGHNFVINPAQPTEDTPSSQMFAITLEELKVQEQNYE